MIKLAILGNCVTTDIFTIINDPDYDIVLDYFRPSIISLMSPRVDTGIKTSDIQIKSKYMKTAIFNDLQKNFFELLQQTEFDYLLIDFISERQPLLKWRGSYYVRSPEFVQSKLEEKMIGSEIIKRNTPEVNDLWKRSCIDFINELKKLVPANKVIFHETYPATQYVKEDHIYNFDQWDLNEYGSLSESLKVFYPFFKENFEGINVITSDLKYTLANSKHIWGLSPFHFIDEYYFDMLNRIKIITDKKLISS